MGGMAAGEEAPAPVAALADEELADEELADEELAHWVTEVRRAAGPSSREAGVSALRAASDRRAAARPPGPPLPLVRELQSAAQPEGGTAGLRLRLYRPSVEPRPLVLYLHGGGFVMGGLASHDAICRRLARIADLAVLAVDYRLAPEHPWPAAVDDAVRAFDWARSRMGELGGTGEAGIGLAGDSAGGAVALLAAARLRDRLTPAAALLLAYPNADMTLSEPSVRAKGHGWGLDANDMRWSVEQWVPDPGRRADPDVSPVHADLAGLPPAVIATAEHDPLRDEGGTLARRMQAAGVHVLHTCYPGLVHGFAGLTHVSPSADRACRDLFAQFGQLIRAQPRAARRT